MLAIVHASPTIGWQKDFVHKISAGLDRLGVSYRVTQERRRTSADLAIVLGTSNFRAVEATGPYLLVDRCSFGDTNHWVSLVRNGHGRRGDHRVPPGSPAARWEKYAQPIEAWHNGPRRVLCGQTETYSPHYATLNDWYNDVRAAATHFRRHPQGDNPTGLPEARSWNGVGQAITLNSSVAVAAVLAGVPTVTMDEGSMAWAVTGHAPGEVIKPARLTWLHWLAHTQFLHSEIEEGEILRRFLD